MSTDAAPEPISSLPPTDSGGDIVARAGTYYRNTRYVMFVLLVAMGGWFMYDGFVKYPRENELVEDLKSRIELSTDQSEKGRLAAELKTHESHNDSALLIQHLLGFTLPPLGAFALWWALKRSRGEIRLSGTKLSVPGHPTIDLSEITEVNNDLWDRKGIAWIDYKTAAGEEGELVLDDFIYDRPPIDAIYEKIAALFGLNEDGDDESDDEADESDDADAEDDDSAEEQK